MSYKFNPHTGMLDLVGGAGNVVADVAATIITREAGETISALKMVIIDSSNNVFYADSNTVYEDSKTIGMAITAGNIGEDIRITTFGVVSDVSFVFSANDQLYLSTNGDITITPPTTPTNIYSVFIGQALGAGEIFINVQEPIAL